MSKPCANFHPMNAPNPDTTTPTARPKAITQWLLRHNRHIAATAATLSSTATLIFISTSSYSLANNNTASGLTRALIVVTLLSIATTTYTVTHSPLTTNDTPATKTRLLTIEQPRIRNALAITVTFFALVTAAASSSPYATSLAIGTAAISLLIASLSIVAAGKSSADTKEQLNRIEDLLITTDTDTDSKTPRP